ncbi:MAG TPA: hypothetical protein VFM52_06050 [Rhodanobacter sp.]|nr:hypothetical protein [Rhodanobacter sp.]
MLDQKIPSRPRVALVFGDAGSARHLRDAVSGCVEIVYEASTAEFDVARLAVSQATAALVNLDDCESLDGVEAGLEETGVAVVFNDPEISSKLDGWAQARWLRHLTAKLSGNSDFDPPRPAAAQTASIVATAAPDAQDPVQAGSAAPPGAEDAPQLVERPLSQAEIESMTADFVAVQEPSAHSMDFDGTAAPLAADAGGTESPTPAIEAPGTETPPPAQAADATRAAGTEADHADALDVDTEALSAMIDARLAAAEGEPVPESPEVWRVIEGGSVSAVELPPIEPEPLAVAPSSAPPQPATPVDDADVWTALPPLDDWQLVDPEAPAVPASAPKRDEHPGLTIDFGGLELVPMETVARVETGSASIEQWMHAGESVEAAGSAAMKPVVGAKGGQA